MQKMIQVVSLAAALAAFTAAPAMASGTHSAGHDEGWSRLGRPGDPAKVDRTIEIRAYDTMRFDHVRLTVRQGETVRIVLRNAGKLKHELVLGDEKALHEHAELMKTFPAMEHDDPNQVSAASGKNGEFVWQFTRLGTIHYGCLEPGHYDAGMKGTITVIAK